MDINQLYELKAQETAESVYVVVIEYTNGHRTLIKDPGMDRPWSSRNRALADAHAQECQRVVPNIRKAGAETLANAFDILLRDFQQREAKRLGRRN